MNECPYCGKDRNIKRSKDLDDLIRSHVLVSEHVGPGGRELEFRHGGRIVLSDMCNSCDYEKLEKFLKEIPIR